MAPKCVFGEPVEMLLCVAELLKCSTSTITKTKGNEKAEFIVKVLNPIKELIPNMTSYTEPSGKVDKSNEYPKRYAWQAFSGRTVNVTDGNTFWYSNMSNAWLSYEWEDEVTIKTITFDKHIKSDISVQYLKDGEWITLRDFDSDGTTDNFIKKSIELPYLINTKSIRFISTSDTPIAIGGVGVLGRK